MADHVHPTAFGQVAIAERALAVLAADGMAVRARPSALIAPSGPSRPRRLQGDATYAYRHAKVSARAAALIARERLRSPPTLRLDLRLGGRAGAPAEPSRPSGV